MQSATAPVALDLKPLRVAGAAMLGIAAVRPALPGTDIVLCPLRRATGVPCPFCGMTRAVTAAVHGDIGASLFFNPGGLVVIALAILLLVAWRWRRAVVPVWAAIAFFGGLWAYQVFKYATDRPL
jgi:hypothetical protein